MSAILGDTAGWHNHLLGAAHIIRQASQLQSYDDGAEKISRTFEGQWLLRNFAYHDILMSVTLNREPIISGRYWINLESMEVDSYMGLACEPLMRISETSSLNGSILQHAERELSFAAGSDIFSSPSSCDNGVELPSPWHADFLSKIYAIERELQNWTCPPSNDSNLVNLAEAYRSAALIHLYRILRSRAPGTAMEAENKIRNQVAAVLYHIRQMSLRCLPECTSLFPLFMAGGEAKSKADMQFVRERLQHIITYRQFQNAASALSVLEELWLQYTSITEVPGGMLDWWDILKRRNWSLALS
jgi:hypothetical protein